MARAHKSLVALVALVAGARSAGPSMLLLLRLGPRRPPPRHRARFHVLGPMQALTLRRAVTPHAATPAAAAANQEPRFGEVELNTAT